MDPIGGGSFGGVDSKAERRAARERVARYHEESLASLISHVSTDLDRYRAGEIDAYEVDETIHHYHRATQELWKFCWGNSGGEHMLMIARIIDDPAYSLDPDWWERGAPRRR